jgi:archaellin
MNGFGFNVIIYFEELKRRNQVLNGRFSPKNPNKIYSLKKQSGGRKKSRKSRGSQGITAAILLISVILSAAGLSFVILTLGSDSAQKIEAIGSNANDYSTSACELIGDLVTGIDTDDDTSIEGITFSLRMILESGSMNLNEFFTELTIIIANNTETILDYNSSLDSIDELGANPNNQYGIKYYNADSDEILEGNEMAMFFIKVGTEISQSQKFTIMISTSSALFKIEKYVPASVSNGSNVLQ